MSSFVVQVRRHIGGPMIVDSVCWPSSLFIGLLLLSDFDINQINFYSFVVVATCAILLQLILGIYFHLYDGRYATGSFQELKSLVNTSISAGVLLTVLLVSFLNFFDLPRAATLVAIPFFILFSGGIRAITRKNRIPNAKKFDGKRTLLYGAGSIAQNLVPQLFLDPKTQYIPVGIIDDDPSKIGKWIGDVKVLGSWDQLADLVQQTNSDTLIVCIARTDALLLRRVEKACRQLGINVIVFPSLEEVLQGKTSLRDLRKLSIEDLVGRRTIDTEVQNIATYLTGKKVLVTGAGGSIGSELCKQISRYNPSKLMMLDRDETGLQQADIGINGNGLLESNDIYLLDIRDVEAVKSLFLREKPDVVFHAAALKHLPLLQKFPAEAWKTNVLGTLNILEASNSVGVETLINISTDKAADPTSTLGKSKKIAESLTSWFAMTFDRKYLSVRFGNVLGSRGSLVPTFSTLIENEEPLTITHPEATRFFMTIPEASQLVLQAGAIGEPSDVLILDMGEPVKIMEIANRMIELSGKKVEVLFTGLRPGEKLHEELYGMKEKSEVTSHPLISRAKVPPLDPGELESVVFY